MRFFYNFLCLLMASGCSTIKKDINNLEQNMHRSSIEISKLEKKRVELRTKLTRVRSATHYLATHKSSFVNGRCITPSRGSKPSPYCPGLNAAKKHALAYCSMSIGCDAILLTASSKLDSFSKRFLASESCQRAVAKLANKGYSVDMTVVNAIEALSDTGCNNEGNGFLSSIGKFIGCTASLTIKLQKIAVFTNCVNRNQSSCYQKYSTWLNRPSTLYSGCRDNLRIVQSESSESILKSELGKVSERLTKERNHYRRLSNSLQKKKESLEYKLFG